MLIEVEEFMHEYHNVYQQAVKNHNKIIITYYSGQENLYMTRLCVPLYYNQPFSNGSSDCYYFWDEDADVGERILSLVPSQIQLIQISDETYNPAEYICYEVI
jgi:hypothetical protein